MSKVLIIGEKKIEFPVEIREKISFENIIIVLYRNDKEIPNNISFFDLNGNLLYTINDIVKAKIPRGFDHIEKKNDNILIAECEIGIIWSDTIKVQYLNCRKTKEYCNEKVRSKFQGRGIKALRRHWNQEGLRTA